MRVYHYDHDGDRIYDTDEYDPSDEYDVALRRWDDDVASAEYDDFYAHYNDSTWSDSSLGVLSVQASAPDALRSPSPWGGPDHDPSDDDGPFGDVE